MLSQPLDINAQKILKIIHNELIAEFDRGLNVAKNQSKHIREEFSRNKENSEGSEHSEESESSHEEESSDNSNPYTLNQYIDHKGKPLQISSRSSDFFIHYVMQQARCLKAFHPLENEVTLGYEHRGEVQLDIVLNIKPNRSFFTPGKVGRLQESIKKKFGHGLSCIMVSDEQYENKICAHINFKLIKAEFIKNPFFTAQYLIENLNRLKLDKIKNLKSLPSVCDHLITQTKPFSDFKRGIPNRVIEELQQKLSDIAKTAKEISEILTLIKNNLKQIALDEESHMQYEEEWQNPAKKITSAIKRLVELLDEYRVLVEPHLYKLVKKTELKQFMPNNLKPSSSIENDKIVAAMRQHYIPSKNNTSDNTTAISTSTSTSSSLSSTSSFEIDAYGKFSQLLSFLYGIKNVYTRLDDNVMVITHDISDEEEITSDFVSKAERDEESLVVLNDSDKEEENVSQFHSAIKSKANSAVVDITGKIVTITIQNRQEIAQILALCKLDPGFFYKSNNVSKTDNKKTAIANTQPIIKSQDDIEQEKIISQIHGELLKEYSKIDVIKGNPHQSFSKYLEVKGNPFFGTTIHYSDIFEHCILQKAGCSAAFRDIVDDISVSFAIKNEDIYLQSSNTLDNKTILHLTLTTKKNINFFLKSNVKNKLNELYKILSENYESISMEMEPVEDGKISMGIVLDAEKPKQALATNPFFTADYLINHLDEIKDHHHIPMICERLIKEMTQLIGFKRGVPKSIFEELKGKLIDLANTVKNILTLSNLISIYNGQIDLVEKSGDQQVQESSENQNHLDLNMLINLVDLIILYEKYPKLVNQEMSDSSLDVYSDNSTSQSTASLIPISESTASSSSFFSSSNKNHFSLFSQNGCAEISKLIYEKFKLEGVTVVTKQDGIQITYQGHENISDFDKYMESINLPADKIKSLAVTNLTFKNVKILLDSFQSEKSQVSEQNSRVNCLVM